jgi:hypothetical protein
MKATISAVQKAIVHWAMPAIAGRLIGASKTSVPASTGNPHLPRLVSAYATERRFGYSAFRSCAERPR